MNPYGTKWRCKDKKHPSPVSGHVNTKLLRLDSTGEFSSDEGSTDHCSRNMGTIIDSALMKIHKKMYRSRPNSLVDQGNVTSYTMPMDQDTLVYHRNMQNEPDMRNFVENTNISPYSAPHWGNYKRKSTCRPCSSFSQCRNSTMHCAPEFRRVKEQKMGFHPAMTGQHFGQKEYHGSRYSPNNRSNRRPTYSFHTPRTYMPSECKSWRNPEPECSWRNSSPNPSSAVPHTDSSPKEVRSDASQRKSPVVEDSSHVNKTSVITNIKCAMLNNQEKSSCRKEDAASCCTTQQVSTSGKTETNENKSPQNTVKVFDWFEYGNSEEAGGTNIPQRIGFKVMRTVSVDSEVSNSSSVDSRNTLQRESSVLSDIFQPDSSVFHVTCSLLPDKNVQSVSKETDTVTSSIPNKEENCTNSERTSSFEAERKSSNEANTTTNTEKKNEDGSEMDKNCARSFVLFVRNNNKKCRPSAKKRRRSKARQDPVENNSMGKKAGTGEQSDSSKLQDKDCKGTDSTQKSGPNTVAFVVDFDSNHMPSSPQQAHSFVFSFDRDWDDAFSEDDDDDSDEFSDGDADEGDVLDLFSCPLQLNVICPMTKTENSCTMTFKSSDSCTANNLENDERNSELDAINQKWRVNFSISPHEGDIKSSAKPKVCFAEGDKLCTVYSVGSEDRKGHWEEFVRDRERFQRRVSEVEDILKPVFSKERRDFVYSKYYGNDIT